jgi:hypothetical protein
MNNNIQSRPTRDRIFFIPFLLVKETSHVLYLKSIICNKKKNRIKKPQVQMRLNTIRTWGTPISELCARFTHL